MRRISIEKKVKQELDTKKKVNLQNKVLKRIKNPTCNHCGKICHTSNKCWSNGKAIFNWDYKTWCRCQYYGEFGYIGMNCVKHHIRRKDTTIRCFTCTKLGHLAKNCMNTGRIKDEKKIKADEKTMDSKIY